MPLGWDIPILESNQNLSYCGPWACSIIVIYGCILHFWNHLHTFAVLCSWNVFVYDHETFKFANNFFIYFIFRKLTCLFTYIWIYYYKINSMLTMKFFSLDFLMIVHLAVSTNVKLYCDTPGVCLVHSYFNPFNFYFSIF